MDMLSTFLKRFFPDLIGTGVAIWLLQAVSTDEGLMHILKIAATIFIILYLMIILLDASQRAIDEHKMRRVYINKLKLDSNIPQIIDASPSPRLIDSSFSNSSSYSPSYQSKNILSFLRIVIIVIIVCILSAFFFYHVHLTVGIPSNIDPTPSVVTTNPWSSWQTIPNKCSVVGETYHVYTPKGQNFNACFGPMTQFKNFTYEAEMTIFKGHCGGLLFRKINNVHKYYVFQVCRDKTYALLKYVDNAGKFFQSFFGVSKDNRVISPGLGVMNTIAVTAQGSAFTLYINHTPIAVIKDTSYSEGTIGLIASSDAYNDTTEVAYQNEKLRVIK